MTSPRDGASSEWETPVAFGEFSIDDAPEDVRLGFTAADDPETSPAASTAGHSGQPPDPPASAGATMQAERRTEAARIDAGTALAEGVSITGLRHVLVLAASLIVWGWGLAQVDESAIGDHGLVTLLPIAALAAIATLIIGFTVAVSNDATGRIPGLYVGAVALALHGLPTFAYEHLRFAWAWRHVGIVEFISRTGEVDRTADSLAVYHNWPGFFGLNAWITTSGQLDSALSYAAWAPIVFNLLFIAALYVLLTTLTSDPRLIWTAVLFFVIGNWVGQDYFGPQAMAFFFYVATLALVLKWFRSDGAERERGNEPGFVAVRRGSLLHRISIVTVTLALLAMTVTHQLTPVVTVVALGAFVAFRIVDVRWPLYAAGLFLAAWVIGPAWGFVIENAGTVLRDVGGFQANVDTGVTNLSSVSAAQANVATAARTLTTGLIGLAALGWITHRLSRLPMPVAVVLAIAPIALILFTESGAQIVFGVFLFALPFLAWLAASVWFPSPDAQTPVGALVALGVVLVTMTGAMMLANFGGDERNVFSAGEVGVVAAVHESAPSNSLLVDLNRDYPGQFVNYENLTYLTVDRTSEATRGRVLADPAAVLADWLANPAFSQGYVVITDSMRVSSERLGSMPIGAVPFIESALRDSPDFAVAFESEDAVAFTLRGAP